MNKNEDKKRMQSAKGKTEVLREKSIEDEATSRYAHTDGERIDVRQMKLNDIINRMQGLTKPLDCAGPSSSKSTGGRFFESCVSLYPEFARRRLTFSLDDIPSGCARNDDKSSLNVKGPKSETDCSPRDFSTPKYSPREHKSFSAREYRSPLLPRKPIPYHGSEGHNIAMSNPGQQVHHFERFQRTQAMGRPVKISHYPPSYSQGSSPEHRMLLLSSPPRRQTPAIPFDRSSLVSSPNKQTPQSRSIIRENVARDLFAQRVPNDARSYTWPREGSTRARARLSSVMYRGTPEDRNLFFPDFKGPAE